MSNVKRYAVKQGKQSIETKVTTDETRGVEVIEYTVKNGKRRQSGKLERDLKTGKVLLPEELRNSPKSLEELMLEEIAAALSEMGTTP